MEIGELMSCPFFCPPIRLDRQAARYTHLERGHAAGLLRPRGRLEAHGGAPYGLCFLAWRDGRTIPLARGVKCVQAGARCT